jgi:hypothetical protein
MSERNKHLFQFAAKQIAEAAGLEAAYHAGRALYWQRQLEDATATVEKTASVSVKRVPHTGGWSPQVVVDYGDVAAYQRMGQAGQKINTHTTARDRFKSDEDLYTTQGDRVYDLDAEDVAHFRFNGRIRDE